MPLEYGLLVLLISLFVVFPCAYGSGKRLIPKKECEKIGSVEVRYNEFYDLYLGHDEKKNELKKRGIIYLSFTEAVEECCPGMVLNFTLVNKSVEYLVEEDILHHHDIQNDSHLVFYFPEFTSQGNLDVYSHQIPFLKLRKSPGFALVMLKSESHLDISAADIIQPSWPIFALVLSLSWAVGILGWALDHRFNPDEFPRPFVRGMFEGFWWAIVTMTTVGYGDKAPRSILARILCIIWILAGAILLSLFTANTTSIITASRFEKNTQTMGKKIGVVNMKKFVESELNLGAQLIEYIKVEKAIEALNDKSIDRLLFPHYLDLLFLMSDPETKSSLSDIYIAKEIDKSYQIGMVLSHNEASTIRHDDFYNCLEIMTSRATSKNEYDYSSIDESIISESKNTFDTKITLQYLYVILGVIGLMLLIGIGFDTYNMVRKSGEKKFDSDMSMDERSKPR